MKNKIIILLFFLLTATSQILAQRIAVIEFKAGGVLSQQEVDGISATFCSHFNPPDGYTLVERSQIENVIDEQGFQQSSITQKEMVRLGEILNVSYFVMGDITQVGNEYNIDVRIVDVQGGIIVAKDGITKKTNETLRETMKILAERLSTQMPAPIKPKVKKDTIIITDTVLVNIPVEKILKDNTDELINLFINQYKDFFYEDDMLEVRKILVNLNEIQLKALISNNNLKNPKGIVGASFGFADRFILKQPVLGVLKIVTLGGELVWYVVDICTAKHRAKNFNFNYIKETYSNY